MAEEQSTTLTPSFPLARVKKIVKIDKDISRISSEAIYLVSGAAEIFLQFLAQKSADIVTEKKRRTIKLDDLRLAVKRHKPTREFLFDSLPLPTVSQPVERSVVDRVVKEKAVPPHTRRIDSFFKKPVKSIRVDDVVPDRVVVEDDVIPDRVEVEDDEIVDRVEVEDEDDVIVDRVEDEDDGIVDRVEVDDDEIVDRVEVEDEHDVIPDRVEVKDDGIVDRVEDVDDGIVDRVEADDDVISDRVEV